MFRRTVSKAMSLDFVMTCFSPPFVSICMIFFRSNWQIIVWVSFPFQIFLFIKFLFHLVEDEITFIQ